jgi:uncharacterized protein (TIGR02588 family)
MARSTKNANKSRAPMIAEWIAGAMGAVMVVGAIGYLIHAELDGRAATPDVEIMLGETSARADGYIVSFKAHNRSSFTAAKVAIRGELRASGEVIETAETELDYLPAYSSRGAGLYFQNDPSKGTVEVFPVSYTDP